MRRATLVLILLALAAPAEAQRRAPRRPARATAPAPRILTGRLEDGDAQLDNGEFYDTYPVQLKAGQTLDVDLTSTAFDTYLLVLGPTAGGETATVGENDDAEEGNTGRSALQVTAGPAGRYQVLATSYAGDETGDYRLQITPGSSAAPPVTQAPTPPTSTAGAVPAGRYQCYRLGSISNEIAPDLFILQGARYRNLDAEGAFSYDPGTRLLRWLSGPLDLRGRGEEWVGVLHLKGEPTGLGGGYAHTNVEIRRKSDVDASNLRVLQ